MSLKGIQHYVLVAERHIVDWVMRCEKLANWISKHWLKLYLRLFYFGYVRNKNLHYRHPRDLNQALMKLSYENSKDPHMRELIPLCVDKYAVREYITAHGYGDTLNECYGIYDNVEDIDFDALPSQFVMKMTNASGRNWICKDKSTEDWSRMKHQFEEWLQEPDFGWQSGEWQYALIKPRIVIEKYLETLGENTLIDYKFQCFHGEPKSCFVGYNRDIHDPHGKVCFDDYDLDWNRTDNIKPKWHEHRRSIPKPKCWSDMIKMATDLSRDFKFVRVDLYEVEGKILFGEMTFTPHGNVMEYYEDKWLKEMLKYLQ